jgi:ATP-dependent RNA circularization protein (DNA/RNA ligase family)
MSFKKYYDMGRIEQLRNSGREFIGKELYITVKRDGQNCGFYKNPNCDMIHIASHRMKICDDVMRTQIKATKEYPKVLEIFEENDNYIIYLEHMLKGRSPTRIEKPKEHNFLILLDIYDKTTERYLNYNYVHQVGHKYKIPVVKLLEIVTPQNMTEIWEIRDKWMKWCRKLHYEGVVIKDYHSKYQCFAKEKIDLPKVKKIKVKDNRPQFPAMPEEKMMSAVEQGMAEVLRNKLNPKDPKEAMPIIAKYVTTEAREHCYSTPKNIYRYYLDYLREMK